MDKLYGEGNASSHTKGEREDKGFRGGRVERGDREDRGGRGRGGRGGDFKNSKPRNPAGATKDYGCKYNYLIIIRTFIF